MEKINILQRFIKSISDFKFSNHFVREKTGKAIGFMMICYVAFTLVLIGLALFIYKPMVSDYSETVSTAINQMPELNIIDGELIVDEGVEFGIYGNGEVIIILDVINQNPNIYYDEQYDDYLLLRKETLYTNGIELMRFDILAEDLSYEEIKDYPKIMLPFFYIALAVAFVVGIIAIFVISALVWALMIIVNGFVKKDISSGDCYKVAIYSMVVPGMIVLASWLSNIAIPYSQLVYLGIAGFYGYQFITNYDPENFDLESIYE